jgi:hypothetical protein
MEYHRKLIAKKEQIEKHKVDRGLRNGKVRFVSELRDIFPSPMAAYDV